MVHNQIKSVVPDLVCKLINYDFILSWEPRKWNRSKKDYDLIPYGSPEEFKELLCEAYCKARKQEIEVETFWRNVLAISDVFSNLNVPKNFLWQFANFAREDNWTHDRYQKDPWLASEDSIRQLIARHTKEATTIEKNQHCIEDYWHKGGDRETIEIEEIPHLEDYLKIFLSKHIPITEVDEMLDRCDPDGANVPKIIMSRFTDDRTQHRAEHSSIKRLIKKGFLAANCDVGTTCYKEILVLISVALGKYPNFLTRYKDGLRKCFVKIEEDLKITPGDGISLPTDYWGYSNIMDELAIKACSEKKLKRTIQATFLASVPLGMLTHYRSLIKDGDQLENDEPLVEAWGNYQKGDLIHRQEIFPSSPKKKEHRFSVEDFMDECQKREIRSMVSGKVVKLVGVTAAEILTRDVFFESFRDYAVKVIVFVGSDSSTMSELEVEIIEEVFKCQEQGHKWIKVLTPETVFDPMPRMDYVETVESSYDNPNEPILKSNFTYTLSADFFG